MPDRLLRIGVDVGGTNTDAVILDLTPGTSTPVLASSKAQTTADVTLGIQEAIKGCLSKTDGKVEKSQIQAVSIGTTSFVNSLVERDTTKLQRVAVIRLCGPYSRLTPPFASFPYELRHVLEGPVFYAEGGLQVDGREITTVDPNEIRGICAEIERQDIKTVAISAIYSPIDYSFQQEELARSIVLSALPGVRVTISKEVANIGLLERENATILNAALLAYAAKTVAGFQSSTHALQLTCPLFLTSNDGTLMTCAQAEKYPIKTFSSGPTNSMRGASFLANLAAGGQARKETALVIDVGGTTVRARFVSKKTNHLPEQTEVGVLLPTGFPRQAAAHHELCGVSLNFSMPHVHRLAFFLELANVSFGLGGGSRVRTDGTGKTTVGPDSVGYRIDESLSFGGQTLTATDIVVAAGRAPDVGNPELVKHLEKDILEAAQARMKTMLELALDSMKTNTQDIPAYLVGGGAILAPDTLRGVSKVYRFPFYDAANAVGAACAQVCGIIDTFEDTSTSTIAEVRKRVEKRAIEKAIAAGASPEKTVIVESESIPIAYTTGRCRFYVKAAGEWTGMAADDEKPHGHINGEAEEGAETPTPIPMTFQPINQKRDLPRVDYTWTAPKMLAYRPKIKQAAWFLSEIDLEWIAAGCYIMGCGGGGEPTNNFIALREMLRKGDEVRVIDLSSVPDDKTVGWGGGIGSPEVSAERLMGEEYNESVIELFEFMKITNVGALAALEIGGGNGMINMITGAKSYLNIPIVDGDFMGRAYPTGWQTTPNVYDHSNKALNILPAAMSSGDGTIVFMTKVKDHKEQDAILRAACVEMGTHAGAAHKPLDKALCEKSMIKNTVSQTWRLGRAVALAKTQANIGNVGNVLVEALGGHETARILFAGKIVDVGRKLYKGHTIGEIVIQALEADEEEGDDPEHPRLKFSGIMKIPFKNENLLCEHTVDGQVKVVAGVPDLIAVLDTQSGAALGTPDYKYGLRVMIIGITAAPQWTDTPRGLELGALPAFGYDLPYVPIGRYIKPRSVIEEYA